ncbi:EAL domain-containing protein [Microaerobacter geothermalis]|uniref:EAL domain-containing protein n=1 Tax=Microaerobacter geothermalis TaxID=674972 RepID=UPI001F209740|nr:EAL domain-containing protein [Microaerobacter geothermalis]MCF6094262.1 EAL domain-containing protein [Microaerobacter geothermalis]
MFSQIMTKITTYYQPILFYENQKVGFEALGRVMTSTINVESIYPWIMKAKLEGWIGKLDCHLLESAFDGAKDLPNDSLLFVNISTTDGLKHLNSSKVKGKIEKFGIYRICIELSEQMEGSIEEIIPFVHRWKKKKGLVAIDDFGQGKFSLNAFSRLKPDFIKLDKWLIHDLTADLSQIDFIRSLTRWAKKFGASVVAEGVENEQYIHELLSLGISGIQGYILGKPSPPNLLNMFSFEIPSSKKERPAYVVKDTDIIYQSDKSFHWADSTLLESDHHLFQQLCKTSQETVKADWVGLWVYCEKTNSFTLIATNEPSSPDRTVLPWETGRNLYTSILTVPDVNHSPFQISRYVKNKGYFSFFDIPVVFKDNLCGTLTFAYRSAKMNMENQMRIGRSYSDIFGIFLRTIQRRSLDVIHSWRSILPKHQSDMARNLWSILIQLVTAEKTDQLLADITRYAQTLTSSVAVILAIPKGEWFEIKVIAGNDRGLLDRLKVTASKIKVSPLEGHPYGNGSWGKAYREKKPIILNDLLTEEEYRPWRDLVGGQGIRSMATLPLDFGDQVFGILSAYSEEPRYFQQGMVNELQSFATLASILLFQAERREEERKHLQALQTYANISRIFLKIIANRKL